MNPVTVDTKTFTRELEWCARFIERKSTIPTLTNVLFQKRGDLLHMTATDLEVGGTTSVETSDGPDFELIAPVHLLIKYLKKVDERSIALLPKIVWTEPCEGPHARECASPCSCDLRPTIVSASLRVEHGDDGVVNIEGTNAECFPVLPVRPLDCIELGGFETAVPRACVSISNEQSRFTLNGALLVVEGKTASIVSTDGHRLSLVDLKAHDAGTVKALIPRNALLEVSRIGDSAFFNSDDAHVFFTAGVRTIVARKLTGTFPDYERVMPRDLDYSAEVSTGAFRKVLERVALFADERSRCVRVTINGALCVRAQMHEHGADGKVPIEPVRRRTDADGYVELPAGLASPYSAGFNADYISDFLKSADVDSVRFLFNKPKTAAELTAQGWRYVLMPMRDSDGESEPCAVGDFEPVPAVVAASVSIPAQPATPDEPDANVASETSERVDVAPRAGAGFAADRVNAFQVANMLGINVATIYNRLKKGKLPEPVREGRAMTWQRSEIEALSNATA